MPTSTDELLKATEAARALLDQLRLSAYTFEVEPREGEWEVRVECAVPEGWQRSVLAADKALLLASAQDPASRARLLAEWGQHLASCRRDKDRPIGVGP
ncbi:MAG: hypothetical protein GTO41_26770 [Burkholderiales bacterium]|nr:hypothetical protein [Burkholderiales bacterium]